MRKFLLFLFVIFFGGIINSQTKVALVDDDNYQDEAPYIETALENAGVVHSTFDLETLDTLNYSDISSYDLVIWYVGGDRIALHLWDTITNPGVVQFYPALKEYYDNADGSIWIDGIDIILPLLVQTNGSSSHDYGAVTRPVDFNSGDFIYDILGIASWDYESYTDDSSSGCPEFDKTSENTITSLDPIQWKWGTVWRADGWTTVAEAEDLYEMGPDTYIGAGYTTFYKYVNNGVPLYVSSIRLGAIGDGSDFSQTNLNTLVGDIVSDVPASINEISTGNFNIYPNPATETVTVNLSDINNASKLTVYDITGKKIFTENITGEKHIILNVSDFTSGLYNIVINAENNSVSAKLSIVK